MTELDCDIIIVGAGPAGATMAIMLAGSGLQVALVDKEKFPRGKICGDALSGQVVSILRRMPDGIYDDFLAGVPKTPSHGTRFISPGMHILDLPFARTGQAEAPGYICQRRTFDEFLLSRARRTGNTTVPSGRPAAAARASAAAR